MPSPDTDGIHSPDSQDQERRSVQRTLQRRDKRLAQAIGAVLIGLAVCAAASLAANKQGHAALMAATALLLVGALVLVRHRRSEQGAALLLSSLTAMGTLFVWFNRGMLDPALLMFPGILIFAGMFGSRRLPALLLAMMLLALAVNSVAELQGWHPGDRSAPSVTTAIVVAVILCVTAFSVGLVTHDLRRALAMLARENRRVHRSRAELAHLAGHDMLTGLPNRVVARERFDKALAQAGRVGQGCAAMCLDLDHFKAVNDSLGHSAGDDLLVQVAQRLRLVVGSDDTVCRLGGDEFLLLVSGLEQGQDAAALATRVLSALAMPFTVQGREIGTTASVGIALCPDKGTPFADVLKNVDLAMYRAKARGGNQYCFFDSHMQAGAVEHTELLAGMRRGLERGEFALHFQPQHSLSSGQLVGAEALLRWRHPTLGQVPPSRFIPVAERSGFIVELGSWVMRQACAQAASWLSDRSIALSPDFRISINLSPAQMHRGDVEHVLHNALADSGLAPERVELELTESMLVEDSRELASMLGRLRAMGLRLAIDDFGTGYSNLGYLKRFEVGRLKIDQSFVRRLTQDSHDAAIVTAIVQMARSLGLDTVAEGVEDSATLAQLHTLGCNDGQGFHWSPALPAEAFAHYLRRASPTSGQQRNLQLCKPAELGARAMTS